MNFLTILIPFTESFSLSQHFEISMKIISHLSVTNSRFFVFIAMLSVFFGFLRILGIVLTSVYILYINFDDVYEWFVLLDQFQEHSFDFHRSNSKEITKIKSIPEKLFCNSSVEILVKPWNVLKPTFSWTMMKLFYRNKFYNKFLIK